MNRTFAALRFFEDANIADRTYWYLCGENVKEGERVLAPVGMRYRLQCARVERILCVEEENAPYDVRLIKRVAGKYKVKTKDGVTDLGALRYEGKRYTRFGVFRFARSLPEQLYGAAAVSAEDGVWDKLVRIKGCALIYGERAGAVAAALLRAAGVDETEIEKVTGDTVKVEIPPEKKEILKNKLL